MFDTVSVQLLGEFALFSSRNKIDTRSLSSPLDSLCIDYQVNLHRVLHQVRWSVEVNDIVRTTAGYGIRRYGTSQLRKKEHFSLRLERSG